MSVSGPCVCMRMFIHCIHSLSLILFNPIAGPHLSHFQAILSDQITFIINKGKLKICATSMCILWQRLQPGKYQISSLFRIDSYYFIYMKHTWLPAAGAMSIMQMGPNRMDGRAERRKENVVCPVRGTGPQRQRRHVGRGGGGCAGSSMLAQWTGRECASWLAWATNKWLGFAHRKK